MIKALRIARTEKFFRRLTCFIHGHNWALTAYGLSVRAVKLGIRAEPIFTWDGEGDEYCMRCGKTRYTL